MEWLSQNKEWMFSGIGVVGFSFIFYLFKWIFKHVKQGTTIEHGVVVIKVKGTKEECENGTAKLISFGSLLVDSLDKPVKYKDTIRANSGILSYNFTPKVKVDKERLERTEYHVLEYEISALDERNKLACTGEIVTHQKLQKKKGGLAFRIPYYARHLIVQIDITDAKFIRDYNGKAKRKGGLNHVEPILSQFNPLTMDIYCPS